MSHCLIHVVSEHARTSAPQPRCLSFELQMIQLLSIFGLPGLLLDLKLQDSGLIVGR